VDVFEVDQVISFEQLCALGLGIVVAEKTPEEKVTGVYWREQKMKWVSYFLLLYTIAIVHL
jgi:hypothetical protein